MNKTVENSIPAQVVQIFNLYARRYPRHHPEHANVMLGLRDAIVYVYDNAQLPDRRVGIDPPKLLDDDPYGFLADLGDGRKNLFIETRVLFENKRKKAEQGYYNNPQQV